MKIKKNLTGYAIVGEGDTINLIKEGSLGGTFYG